MYKFKDWRERKRLELNVDLESPKNVNSNPLFYKEAQIFQKSVCKLASLEIE